MKKEVVITEIWKPTNDPKKSSAYHFGLETNLECVAILANGRPLKLKEDYVVERNIMTKEQVDEKYETPKNTTT